MAISYETAVREGWPDVIFKCNGDPFDYNNLDWEGGDALPSQDEINEWILANPGFDPLKELTKYEFRQLFTLNERVAIDKSPFNTAIPENYRDILRTILKDLELSGVVHLDNPATAQGVQLLEQLGLLAAGRSAQVLAGETPVV